jgi:hypothetical protein
MDKFTIDALLEQYEKRLSFLADDGYADSESLLTLFKRDEIANREGEFNSHQLERLYQLDQILIGKRKILSEVLPNYLSKDRKHWWWFLDEGILELNPPPG